MYLKYIFKKFKLLTSVAQNGTWPKELCERENHLLQHNYGEIWNIGIKEKTVSSIGLGVNECDSTALVMTDCVCS